MSIRANELMAGDLVRCTFFANVCRVSCIRFEVGYGFVKLQGDYMMRSDMSIIPIVLTTEILINNGWINDDDDEDEQLMTHTWRSAERTIMLSEMPENGTFMFNGIVIKYVHELQHALKLQGKKEEADRFVA